MVLLLLGPYPRPSHSLWLCGQVGRGYVGRLSLLVTSGHAHGHWALTPGHTEPELGIDCSTFWPQTFTTQETITNAETAKEWFLLSAKDVSAGVGGGQCVRGEGQSGLAHPPERPYLILLPCFSRSWLQEVACLGACFLDIWLC